MSDSVSITDECITAFNEFRMSGNSKGSKTKFIIFKIADNKKEVVIDEVSQDEDYEVFRTKLDQARDAKGNPAPRYAVYDVEYDLGGGEGKRYDDGDGLTTRENLKNALNIHTSIHADDKSDIEWKTVLAEASGGKAGK
ncbi:cofilin [Aspergillus luchuensis]|uniref:Cofilin n=1 Tax=Aspergillus kawachii TaxID=1069201 RepID=A0A146EZF2_ASPKA|nr:cofilin [Aspergillus luchuensis]